MGKNELIPGEMSYPAACAGEFIFSIAPAFAIA
jgi:hypothetical protein